MLSEENRTAALSSLVLQLHRGCRSWPAAAFQDRACELLAEVLPFDSALWGAENPASLRRVALQPYRVPDALWARYLTQPHDGGRAADLLLAAARQATGTAVACDFAAIQPAAGGDAAALGADGLAALGVAYGLAMAQAEPLSKLRSFFCVWRMKGGAPFTTDDQRLLQFVVPHLMETARESQLARAGDTADAAAAPRSHAVSNLQGVLHHLDDRCQALLRLEWPQWQGGLLPAPLLAALSAALQQPGVSTFVGRRMAVRLSISGSTVLLAVRLRAASDRLSARQRGIAELYASGCTGPEIAQRLGLAASTVNNHLGEVFKKLQVSSKVQLARVLMGRES